MSPHRHEDQEQEPLFSVVRGNPTEEELAALTVVLLQRRSAPKPAANPLAEVGRLLARRQRLGAGLRPGPGSWRRARPR
ncbi:acyl-CoA carboxylase subunit epsilon [Rothia kristinae]|uniref:Acyl-CoA carboxylase subunit epsilon n=1 Tax=Rothia kristinae TaxID=37923 RepID=A0A7T4T4W3_9MICC|nr:acyl-CoA carboxylase subunit epsilon [Rothia kristinae]QQC59987.1 acyl-CoA carboxylase subunit epsilon [Rothia kristinae]